MYGHEHVGPTGLEVFEILTRLGGVGENEIGVRDARIWLDRPSDVTSSAQAKRYDCNIVEVH